MRLHIKCNWVIAIGFFLMTIGLVLVALVSVPNSGLEDSRKEFYSIIGSMLLILSGLLMGIAFTIKDFVQDDT
jgi:Zn-dependent protease with chaperone function